MKSALSVLLIVVTCWECIHSKKYGCANTDGTNLRLPEGNENGDRKLTFEGFIIKAEEDLGAFDVRVHQQDGDAGQICYSHKGGKTEVSGDCATPIDGIYIQFHPKGSQHLSKVCEFNGVAGPKCPPGQRYVKGGACAKVKRNDCKITNNGVEYNGDLSVTTSGKTCLNWATHPYPKHLDSTNPAKGFPEKNLEDAVNYCRNPGDSSWGPWCYTKNDASWEACDVKFCARTECKLSQRGTEYVGKVSVTYYGKKCLNWATHPTKSYLDPADLTKYFRETNLEDAVNYCRNGDGSRKGPWCYIDNAGYTEVCDIPFCPGAPAK